MSQVLLNWEKKRFSEHLIGRRVLVVRDCDNGFPVRHDFVTRIARNGCVPIITLYFEQSYYLDITPSFPSYQYFVNVVDAPQRAHWEDRGTRKSAFIT